MNANRKKDREAIAAMMLAVADKFGAKVQRYDEPPNPGYSGAGISLRFTLNGVGAMVDIDNQHGPGESLMSWHNDYSDPERKTGYFSPAFNVAIGDLSHTRPHHKATSYGTWDLLAARLQAGLRHAASNTAFLQEESAQ